MMARLFILVFFALPLATFSQIPAQFAPVNEVYGTQCGFAGTPPEGRVMIEQWIKTNQTDQITSWLYGPFPVRNTYAAEAIIRMMASGEVFDNEVLDRLDEVKGSEEKIAYCSGCIYSEATMSSLLSSRKIW